MKRIVAAIGVFSALFLTSPVALAAQDNVLWVGPTGGEGQHPWDARYRRTKGHINTYRYVTDEEYYYSPFRSRTHALHPYNRDRYYDSVGYDYQPLTGRTSIREVPEHATVSPLCDNYTFQRPNYRIPPFGHRCL